MGMMLPPLHQVSWLTLLICGCTYRGLDAIITNGCNEDDNLGQFLKLSSSKEELNIKKTDENNFTCLLYPTNVLNCSWSFQSLEREAQLTVKTSVCEDHNTVSTLESEGRVGSSNSQIENEDIQVTLHFNISLQNQWTVYYYKYDIDTLEVLHPPPNVTAAVTDGDLLVIWGLPSCRKGCSAECFEFELRLGDQERSIHLEKRQSYYKYNVDLTQSYSVTIRTRLSSSSCSSSHHWSDWSEPFTVPAVQPPNNLNALVIVAISLGIPMILLALLLLVRYQSLSKLLFPPIPCPPPKYRHVLQNNDPFVYPDLTAKHDEEVTLVFYSDPEKTHKL